ncbi:hypothetical protein L218DRAFT_159772 [Marasmius fiardii PR-910]|nr:hypothetical protein L218DRAFT_159772 [Marasmius fiardii PR-910]
MTNLKREDFGPPDAKGVVWKRLKSRGAGKDFHFGVKECDLNNAIKGHHAVQGKGKHGAQGKGQHDATAKEHNDAPGKGKHGAQGKGQHDATAKGHHDAPGKGHHDAQGKGQPDAQSKGQHGAQGKGQHGAQGKGQHGAQGKGQHTVPAKGQHTAPAKAHHDAPETPSPGPLITKHFMDAETASIPPAAPVLVNPEDHGWIPVNWTVGADNWIVTDPATVNEGISRYQLYFNGHPNVFDYTLEFTNTTGWSFHFLDETKDCYSCETLLNRDHYFKYSSDKPTIKYIKEGPFDELPGIGRFG